MNPPFSSFRLLSELYSLLWGRNVYKRYRTDSVSVSSRSYILSYLDEKKREIDKVISYSFRLLSELYSLLYSYYIFFITLYFASFRLLSELYSLLWFGNQILNSMSIQKFPSPLGVIFSLIVFYMKLKVNELVSVSSRSYILSYSKKMLDNFITIWFPSPLGVIFSLIKSNIELLQLGLDSFRLLSELYSLL